MNLSFSFYIFLLEKQAKYFVLWYIVPKRKNVSPMNQVNSSIAISSISWLQTMNLQPNKRENCTMNNTISALAITIITLGIISRKFINKLHC